MFLLLQDIFSDIHVLSQDTLTRLSLTNCAFYASFNQVSFLHQFVPLSRSLMKMQIQKTTPIFFVTKSDFPVYMKITGNPTSEPVSGCL